MQMFLQLFAKSTMNKGSCLSKVQNRNLWMCLNLETHSLLFGFGFGFCFFVVEVWGGVVCLFETMYCCQTQVGSVLPQSHSAKIMAVSPTISFSHCPNC